MYFKKCHLNDPFFNNCFNLFFEMSVYFNESYKLHLCSLLMTINGYIFFFIHVTSGN